jgi:hypothetical protein
MLRSISDSINTLLWGTSSSRGALRVGVIHVVIAQCPTLFLPSFRVPPKRNLSKAEGYRRQCAMQLKRTIGCTQTYAPSTSQSTYPRSRICNDSTGTWGPPCPSYAYRIPGGMLVRSFTHPLIRRRPRSGRGGLNGVCVLADEERA